MVFSKMHEMNAFIWNEHKVLDINNKINVHIEKLSSTLKVNIDTCTE